MLINGKNEVFMIDRDNSVFHIANLEFPFRKDPSTHLANTLLDGVSHSYLLLSLFKAACSFGAAYRFRLPSCLSLRVPRSSSDANSIRQRSLQPWVKEQNCQGSLTWHCHSCCLFVSRPVVLECTATCYPGGRSWTVIYPYPVISGSGSDWNVGVASIMQVSFLLGISFCCQQKINSIKNTMIPTDVFLCLRYIFTFHCLFTGCSKSTTYTVCFVHIPLFKIDKVAMKN